MKRPQRTKQVKKMIEAVNVTLRENHISNGDNELFSTFNWLLLQAECYYGYNIFIEKTIDEMDLVVLARQEEFDEHPEKCFLQFL